MNSTTLGLSPAAPADARPVAARLPPSELTCEPTPKLTPVPGSEPRSEPTPGAARLDEPGQIARFTRWSVDAQGQRTGESSLRLSGIYCAACAGPIAQALGAVEGVLEVNVNPATQRASVRWDPARTRPSALVAAVQRAGYDAHPDTRAAARALRRTESRQALWRLFVAGFCAMQVMMLATPAYVAGPGGIEPDLLRLLHGDDAARDAVLGGTLLPGRVGGAAPPADRHGRAGVHRHRGEFPGELCGGL
jgi:copper chaperone CopZ